MPGDMNLSARDSNLTYASKRSENAEPLASGLQTVSAAAVSAPIAIFLPSLRGGGAERAMLNFASELLERSYPVDIVVARHDGALTEIAPAGARIVDFGCSRVAKTLPQLVRYLNQVTPRALFATIVNANVVAAIAGKLSRAKTPVVVRQSNAPLSEPKNTVGRWVVSKILPWSYRASKGIIAVSNGVAGELATIDARLTRQISVVPTPVISRQLLQLGEEQPEHPWMHDAGPPVVLAAARLQPHKGLMVLLRAVAEVRQHRSVRLLILGDGTERARLEAEAVRLGIAEAVSLPGFVHNPFCYMRRAAAFVLSSEYEGLPNALIQALAFGVPAVSTDCPCGPSEILAGGRYGELIPVNDAAAMAAAILRVVGMPRREDARARVLSQYGVEGATDAYLSVAGLG